MIDTNGDLNELEGAEHAPLGVGNAQRSFCATTRRLYPGERLLLVTDGIIERRLKRNGVFGIEGIRHALEQAESNTAASTAMAIQQAVTENWREPLEDDGTVVVMAID